MAPSILKVLTLSAVAAAAPNPALNGAASPAQPAAAAATTGPAGNIIVPGGVAPEVQNQLKPEGIFPGSQRVKVRYGPYNMPGIGGAMDIMAAVSGEKGTMNTVAVAMKKPCSATCGITKIQAGLEYANGSIANTNNGAWLHHVVMLATGSGKQDTTCPTSWGLMGERFFSSGNERSVTTYGDILKGNVKAVYQINSGDTFSMQLELMNMDTVTKSVYYTMDYEILPTIPSDYRRTKAAWLDVTNCGASFVSPPAGQKKFTLKMNPWTSTVTGQMLGVAGHLHDGGVIVNVYHNNKNICPSTATYALPGQGSLAMAGDNSVGPSLSYFGNSKRDGVPMPGMEHIDQMKACQNMGTINKGDKVYIDAQYDFNAHMGMGEGGRMAPVMGIAIMFITV